MTNTEITQTIEKEFGWLSPDEKQKLNVMMVRTWNEAIVASADLVVSNVDVEMSNSLAKATNPSQKWVILPNDIKTSINTLKLKL